MSGEQIHLQVLSKLLVILNAQFQSTRWHLSATNTGDLVAHSPWAGYSHLYAFVTKQYNLVLISGW